LLPLLGHKSTSTVEQDQAALKAHIEAWLNAQVSAEDAKLVKVEITHGEYQKPLKGVKGVDGGKGKSGHYTYTYEVVKK